MTHKKHNFWAGAIVTLWIVFLIWVFYFASADNNIFSKRGNKNNTSITTNTAWSCGWWSCGCGWGAKKVTTTAPVPAPVVDQNTTYEEVYAGHDEYALVPETVNLKAGKSYKLTITPTADGWGCMYSMTIPGIDENVYDIKKGVPITIIINNAKAGKYEVVCGSMWMHQWRINIQ